MSTHNISFSIYRRKINLIILNLPLWDFFQGTQKQVQNIRGRRAISVRAIEVYCISNVLLNFHELISEFNFVFQRYHFNIATRLQRFLHAL